MLSHRSYRKALAGWALPVPILFYIPFLEPIMRLLSYSPLLEASRNPKIGCFRLSFRSPFFGLGSGSSLFGFGFVSSADLRRMSSTLSLRLRGGELPPGLLEDILKVFVRWNQM